MVEENTLFGYPIPFPRSDLFIAFTAVALFLPVVVIVHHSVVKTVGGLFGKSKKD